MKCSCCRDKASVLVSWPASVRQEHVVCDGCAADIWNTISTRFIGTEAYLSFTIMPLSEFDLSEIFG